MDVKKLLGTSTRRDADLSSSAGRAAERSRRIARNTIASGLAKGVSVLGMVVTLPLALGTLGTERFGVLVTLVALTAVVSLADLGIANGLVTAVARARAVDDTVEIARLATNAFATMLLIAMALLLGWLVASPHVDWAAVLNTTSPEAQRETGPAVLIFVVCVLSAIPFAVIAKVQLAFQEGATVALWQASGSVLSTCAVGLCALLDASLPMFVAAQAGGLGLATVGNAIHEVLMKRRWLLPSVRHLHWRKVRQVSSVGALFLVINLGAALTFQVDVVIVGQLYGADAVADYAIPQRLFLLAPMIAALALAPLWPAYGDALSRGDREWVRRTFRKSLWLAGGINAITAVGMVAAGPWLVHVWVGSRVEVDSQLLVFLGLWSVVYSIGGATAMLLNGLGTVGAQAAAAGVLVLLNLALAVVLGRAIGIAGVALGSAIALLIVEVPLVLRVRQQLRTDAFRAPALTDALP